MSVLVFTATLNEVDNILEWYDKVRSIQPECMILVVDDNSIDGTIDQLVSISSTDQNFHYVVRPSKLGLGSAHKYAFNFASQQNISVLVTMDSDLSHDPLVIPQLISQLKTSDFVVGTRRNGGGCEYSGIRKILSSSANISAKLILPTGLSEYTNSFRCFSREAIEVLANNLPPDDSYAFFIEQIEHLFRSGLRLAETPIYFRDRMKGKSKIPRNQILVSVAVLLKLGLKRRLLKRKFSTEK